MKRILLYIVILATITNPSYSQISRGGQPFTYDIVYQIGQVEKFETENPTFKINILNTLQTQTQRTTQPKQYRNEGERFLKESPPLLYQQYLNGRKMTKYGLTLTISGGIAIISGGVLAAFSSMLLLDVPTASVVLFAVGGGCVTAGVPLMIIGGAKKRNAYNTFRKEYPAKQTISHFQLNVHGNGLGFAYVF